MAKSKETNYKRRCRSFTAVLELISKFNFNISYISSQENGSDYQQFKMGLYVNDLNGLSEFQAERLCEVILIDYERKIAFTGDVLTAKPTITKLTPRNEKNGIVEVTIDAFNQKGELVLTDVTEAIVKIGKQ